MVGSCLVYFYFFLCGGVGDLLYLVYFFVGSCYVVVDEVVEFGLGFLCFSWEVIGKFFSDYF